MESLVPARCLISVGGQWQRAADGSEFSVYNPSTSALVTSVADGTADDGRSTAMAAASASSDWAAVPARCRRQLLEDGRRLMLERAEILASLIAIESGKARRDARAEVLYAAEFMAWYAGEAVRVNGYSKPSPSGDSQIVVIREPVGPCLLVTPWNFPLAMPARKVAAAIAAGCSMVLKPAEAAPLSALAFAELLEEVGLPDGVLNVVPTSQPDGVVRAALGTGVIRKLSFTGSTAVGRHLLALSAEGVVRCSMELGGNNPFVVLPDADLDLAVDALITAKLRGAGQTCTAPNRIYVARPLLHEFVDRLGARVAKLTVGDASVEGTDIGPVIDSTACSRLASLVDDAIAVGAETILEGGRRSNSQGSFFDPVILTSVPERARVMREEIFGPVLAIATFEADEEVRQRANATTSGLAAYVIGADTQRAIHLGRRLEVGMVAVNRGLVSDPGAPFGGVKASGLGREGGSEGIADYLEPKYFALNA